MYLEYYLLGIILLPAIILAIIAQSKVNSTYSAYSKVLSQSGKPAHEVARFLLDAAGLGHIRVTRVSGHLTDHYDPKKGIVALSAGVHDSTSISALGIAAHEVGHAVQYKEKYFPIKIRAFLIPVTNFASNALWPIVFLGLILNFGAGYSSLSHIFIIAGVAVFGFAALLNIITLPVEFNASSRALRVLSHTQLLSSSETAGAKKVLSAAALTYVAAMLISVLNLVRFLLATRSD